MSTSIGEGPGRPNELPSELAEIVADNRAMMQGEMIDLLSTESIGGNAGTGEIDGIRYGRAAANGFVNLRSGRIVAFGNIQDVPDSITNDPNNGEFGLIVAVDHFSPVIDFFRIVSTYGEVSDQARWAVGIASERYNAEMAARVLTPEQVIARIGHNARLADNFLRRGQESDSRFRDRLFRRAEEHDAEVYRLMELRRQ